MEMKEVNYRICCEELTCEEETCLCYGIVHENGTIHHISTDKSFVELITDLVNRLQLSPDRARDLIEHLIP